MNVDLLPFTYDLLNKIDLIRFRVLYVFPIYMNVGVEGVTNASSSVADVAQVEQFVLMQEMVCDALRQPETFEAPNSNNMEEPPNEDTRRFYILFVVANKPLYKGASDSKLSIFVRLIACKSNWNILD